MSKQKEIARLLKEAMQHVSITALKNHNLAENEKMGLAHFLAMQKRIDYAVYLLTELNFLAGLEIQKIEDGAKVFRVVSVSEWLENNPGGYIEDRKSGKDIVSIRSMPDSDIPF